MHTHQIKMSSNPQATFFLYRMDLFGQQKKLFTSLSKKSKNNT